MQRYFHAQDDDDDDDDDGGGGGCYDVNQDMNQKTYECYFFNRY